MSKPKTIVSSQLNNSSTTTTLKLELLSQWLTDYFNNNSLVMSEEFVSWFWKYSKFKNWEKILSYTRRHPVFSVPALSHAMKINKRCAYEIISKLRTKNLIKKTDYKLNPPIKSVRGAKPRIFIVASIRLTGPRDHRIEDARIRYERTFNRQTTLVGEGNKLYASNLQLKTICKLGTDYFTEKGQSGKLTPPIRDILYYLKNLPESSSMDPVDVNTAKQIVYNNLKRLRRRRRVV